MDQLRVTLDSLTFHGGGVLQIRLEGGFSSPCCSLAIRLVEHIHTQLVHYHVVDRAKLKKVLEEPSDRQDFSSTLLAKSIAGNACSAVASTTSVLPKGTSRLSTLVSLQTPVTAPATTEWFMDGMRVSVSYNLIVTVALEDGRHVSQQLTVISYGPHPEIMLHKGKKPTSTTTFSTTVLQHRLRCGFERPFSATVSHGNILSMDASNTFQVQFTNAVKGFITKVAVYHILRRRAWCGAQTRDRTYETKLYDINLSTTQQEKGFEFAIQPNPDEISPTLQHRLARITHAIRIVLYNDEEPIELDCDVIVQRTKGYEKLAPCEQHHLPDNGIYRGMLVNTHPHGLGCVHSKDDTILLSRWDCGVLLDAYPVSNDAVWKSILGHPSLRTWHFFEQQNKSFGKYLQSVTTILHVRESSVKCSSLFHALGHCLKIMHKTKELKESVEITQLLTTKVTGIEGLTLDDVKASDAVFLIPFFIRSNVVQQTFQDLDAKNPSFRTKVILALCEIPLGHYDKCEQILQTLDQLKTSSKVDPVFADFARLLVALERSNDDYAFAKLQSIVGIAQVIAMDQQAEEDTQRSACLLLVGSLIQVMAFGSINLRKKVETMVKGMVEGSVAPFPAFVSHLLRIALHPSSFNVQVLTEHLNDVAVFPSILMTPLLVIFGRSHVDGRRISTLISTPFILWLRTVRQDNRSGILLSLTAASTLLASPDETDVTTCITLLESMRHGVEAKALHTPLMEMSLCHVMMKAYHRVRDLSRALDSAVEILHVAKNLLYSAPRVETHDKELYWVPSECESGIVKYETSSTATLPHEASAYILHEHEVLKAALPFIKRAIDYIVSLCPTSLCRRTLLLDALDLCQHPLFAAYFPLVEAEICLEVSKYFLSTMQRRLALLLSQRAANGFSAYVSLESTLREKLLYAESLRVASVCCQYLREVFAALRYAYYSFEALLVVLSYGNEQNYTHTATRISTWVRYLRSQSTEVLFQEQGTFMTHEGPPPTYARFEDLHKKLLAFSHPLLKEPEDEEIDNESFPHPITEDAPSAMSLNSPRPRPGSPRAKWVRDGDAADCHLCCAPFTFYRRRHHCRQCGNVVCGECSPSMSDVEGYDTPQRICNRCSLK